MSHCVIVPDSLREAIDRSIDKALKDVPDAAKDREYFFNELLRYFNDHGVVPDFQIVARATLSDDCDDLK